MVFSGPEVWRPSDAALERRVRNPQARTSGLSIPGVSVRRVGMARYGVFIYSPAAGVVLTTIRADVVSDGPFHEDPLVAAEFLVVVAPDLDVALAIVRAHPGTYDGGAEVRPLFEPWAYRREP